MTLKEQIERQISRLGAGGGALRATVDVGTLESELTEVDKLACAFTSFQLKTDRLAGATLERLKKISDALSQRISYLLEPISLIETDADGCTVQMRSNPPHQDEHGASYYELLVRRDGELSLARYAKQPGNAREVIPAHVTREVLGRLAEDFAAVVS